MTVLVNYRRLCSPRVGTLLCPRGIVNKLRNLFTNGLGQSTSTAWAQHRAHATGLRHINSTLIILLTVFFLTACSKPTAPEVSFTDLKGNQFSLAQLKGTVVLVNFWATSCTTCVAKMPEMIKTYEQFHAQGLELVAVAMSYDPPNYVVNFTETRKLPFPVALDFNGKLAHAFGDVKLTPTTFVIDKQGNIIKKYVGAPDFAQLHQLLEVELGTITG